MPNRGKTFREVPIVTEEATATFHFADHHEEEIREAVGAILTAPANTAGYFWHPAVPATMPAENTTYREIAEDAEKFTVTWYLPNGNPIVWYELYPGETIPEAPECPEGHYWHPYPATMPDHDLDIIPELIRG